MSSEPSKYSGTSSLARALDGITKPAFQKRGFEEHRIITDWKHIVGEVIARYSMPQKLVFPLNSRDQGVLSIEVYDSAFATEIHYLGPLILEKIATYFGYQAVARLNIMQRPLEIEPEEAENRNLLRPVDPGVLEDSVTGVGDNAVKEALKSLGRYIIGTSTEK